MMKKLKDLTQVYKKEDKEITQKKSKVIELDERDRKQTYHESGFRESTRNFGDRIALNISLKAIYAKFQNEEKENESKQIKYNEPYLLEKSEIETEIKTKSVVLDNLSEKIEERRVKIENLKQEITNIPLNPENYGIDAKKGASVKFWIGVLLLIPITLYLITFYVSTSYSAFFKKFEIGDGVIQSILDANAFTKSWSDGPLEGMFVTFIPFVFMGLGFLIHIFGEKKSLVNGFKIFALFVVTFIFDAILAYLIESNLYELSKGINSPDFDLSLAFQAVAFWGIIFAGFLVYIIWGLVFDFLMKEHAEKDKINVALNQRKANIKIERQEVEKLVSNTHAIKEYLEKLKGKVEELKRLINGIIIPVKEYQLYASEYMQGWVTSINQNLHGSALKKQELIHSCNETYMLHAEEVGSNQEVQNKIFLSES
ncbi:beta-carotene 15,15'-monooxygenase [Polaribacter sp. SA4-10]|uniref:beta-carotene 15,15'-monooxygenase n=1 Tax=Polaribacter sp. SA4-10 TaxID=754397 RepID=UPI000B565266|nr:beta-carotene 15,15'-monooxygenase [Polaribacter sp. SA4-10]ARV05745.1 beta-carotene 15,15'-monooxygenase [Polaribacter sp. SA4-10]